LGLLPLLLELELELETVAVWPPGLAFVGVERAALRFIDLGGRSCV
jgi:hypothetical protein